MEKQCLLPIFPNPASRSANSRTATSLPVSLPDHDLDLLKSTYTTAAVIDSLLIKAWAVVLRCYTGSDDLCLGYQTELPGADERLESNVVAIRIGEEDRISELRRREISTSRSDSGHFDFVSFNTVFLRKIEKEDVDSTSSESVPEGCRIRFCIEDYFGRPSLTLEYWRDEMSTGHVTCMAQVLSQIISQLLASEDRTVGQLDFFTPQDSTRVAKWNTSMPPTQYRLIHEIVQEQCRKWPVKEAICAWDGSFTFSEFDSITTRLASYLQSQGVGPETMVPLCFEKTKWYTIAVYAVLKAGGAFVPLDPSHPETRLRSLIEKVGAKLVLTSSEQQSKLALTTVIPVIAIDDDLLSRCISSVIAERVTPDNAAYIIFTSGSTGEPKGTVIEHRAFSSSCHAHTPALRLTPDCRVLQFAAHTFDASLAEILSGLMNGATLCIPSEESRVNDLPGVINKLSANYISLTPSVVEFLTPAMIPQVQTVILAGEAMAAHQRDMWCGINLVNGFGPTETCITSAGNPNVTRETDVKDIGLPIGGRCWIVDPNDHHRMMPVGAVGEMLVEGPTLARGYLNNPEKTAEAFIYAPSWATDTNEAGEKRRFYKSGDLVRYNSAQGALTYIGRKDTQVKLHGQRVELGEIESRLTADVDIQLAVVYVPKAGYAKGKLVTVFCFAGANHTEARELLLEHASEQRITGLRQRVGTVLPTYMVPGIWLSVESLPLLSSGKLDRKKVARWLEEMEEDPQFELNPDEEVDPSLYTPANETEKLLAEAWSRVLNIPVHRLKLTESFLKLGGDSLTAMTCTNLCKRAGFGVSVQDILRRTSVRDLALHTSAIESPTSYEEKLEEKFDLSPIQYLHSLVRTEGQSYFNQSIQTRVQQNLSESQLRDAIKALVARHGMLRARFSLEGPEQKMQQRITSEIESSFRLNCQSVQNENLVDHVISTSQQSINCFVGPLLSVDLINVPDRGQILSLVGHHLVVDIVSFRLILSDLEELLMEPGKTAVPTPSMPYQMWTAKQLRQAEADTESANEFDSAPPHNFDFWEVDNNITYGQVKCSTFEVSQESTSLLLTGCHESLNTETVDLLLACMLHSFAEAFPDGPTPVINNEGHGREPWDSSIDISRTVGWFTTLYPIWVPGISASQDLLQTVAHVKDMRRRATDNGRAFFAHRTLTVSGREKFPHPVPMEMSFNYLGQNRDLQNQKGLFHLADTMVGETREGGGAADYGRQTPRFALFEISAAVIEGQLRFTFSFGKSISHQDKVQTWLKNCQMLLEKLPHQLLAAPPTKTVSDFPMLKMSHEELENIESGTLPRYGITSLHAVEDMYPCTRMQQGILLSRCRNPLLYAVHTTFEVRGMGSVQETTRGILAGWSKLVSHHSMLRTIFVDRLIPGTPFGQVVLKDIGYAEPAQLSCDDEEHVLSTFASRDIVPYHDSHRFSICSVNNSGKVFCRLEMNHAAMDGASISILLRDLKSACTKSFSEGAKPEFRNFAKHAQKQTSRESMEFWTTYLDGAQPCHIQLNPKGNNLANRSSIRTSRIELKDYSRLNSFCESAGITQSTVFNVAWGLLLAFLTQSDDVSFAYTTSLRDAPVEGIDAMIGPVMNLNVCRIKLAAAGAGLSLFDVLQKTQDDFAASLPHRACSLIDVLHEMKQGDKSLFNSGVSYRKLPQETQTTGNGAVEFVQKGFIHDPAETAVYVNVEATDKSATIELNHWTDCLSEAQAELIAELYVEKIEDIICDSGKQQIVGELRQIGNEEKSIFGEPEQEQEQDLWAQAVANVEPCLLPSMVGVDSAPEDAGVHSMVQYSVQQPAKLLQFCKENDFDAPLLYQFVWAVVLRLYSGKSQPCFGTLDTLDAGHRLGYRVVNTEDATPIMEALKQLKNDSASQSAAWISAAKVAQQSAKLELPFDTLVYTKSGEEAATTATINSLLSGGNVSAVVLSPAPLTRRSGLVKLYHSKSHSRDYVEAMTNCFLHILTQLPTKARQSIADLDFVDDKSCARFEEWSAPMPRVHRCCAHDIILEQAIRQPSAPAVSAWDGSLDYSELIALSNQFALKLQSLGVGPNVYVACLFDKSMWAVVAQLSVMRAGGAFVSIDPTHAEERLRTLVGEIQAPVVLCSASRLDIAERISDMAIALEKEELIDDSPMLDPETVKTTYTDPAYGVFTSGTTGTPKLTVVEHAALTVSASGWKDILGFSERARVFQFSAFTFDVSVMDVFFTLLNGGCICMPSEADRMNDLAGAINRSGATLMSQVPSLFATIDPATVPTLQYLVSGGEKMSPAFMEQWKSRHVVNAYGPSESTVVATVSIKSDGSGELINNDGTDIGVPACGRAWVVDAENPNKLLPHGAIGELLLEGPNVGRGYLNNQAKTDHAFVKNLQWTSDVRLRPVFGGQVQRMYRTGDLARFATHGSLTFLTRNDTQVKLKGQRVELEEIEHHASILAATDVLVDIVTPKENTMAAGLAAFFVSSVESGEPADSVLLPMTASRQKVVEGLRQGLPHQLPLYMVPTFYFPVSHIPRTTSSKLDRRGLQTMAAALTKDTMKPYTSTASVAVDAPKTGLEPLLRGLWEKVMNLSAGSVSDNDSFFGLGGDSFAAMTLVSAAQAKGLSLTVADVFTHPTLVDMCHACQSNDPKQAERALSTEPFSLIPAGASREEVLADASDVCDVEMEAIEDVYPCSPVQSGLITSSTTKPGAYVVRSIYRLADSVDLERFQAAWQRTVDELAILRTRIVHTADAGFCQVVLRSSPIQWSYASHLPKHSDNVPALPKSEGDVLTDYTIVNTGSERFFAWSLHHAAYDGWSIGLMLQIAQEHYMDIASAHKTTPAPYSLFIDYLSQTDSAASDEFWKTNLDGFNTPAFPVIKDNSRQIVTSSRQHNTMDLPKIYNTEVTLPVMIRAAWAMTIADQSEAADVCFGETLMARNINLPGVTTMAGPVLTTVPTRVQVNNKNTVLSLLQSINQHMVDVIPHQHAGVQRIRRLAKSASTACDFQNLLVVQSEDQALEKSVWDFEDIQAGEEFFTHPLVVECKVAGSKIKTTAHHDEQVIAADKVNRLVDRFNFILKQLSELPKNSNITVGHIDLVGPSDKAQILKWNSDRIQPIEKTIHDLVFKQRVLQPDAEAICAWDGTLSYREMCDHAAVFAHYLVSLGLGKEMFVPVCMDKSAWMVVAILGVLAAGGAYVPLDPAHPASRHAEIIEDVGAKFVICLPKYSQRYASKVEMVLPVDRSVFDSMKKMSSERPLGRSASNNMAYALFTSGSTGKPKGIVTEHASFVTSVSAFGPVVHLNRGTRAFHFASLTFDAAVMEIWGTLIFGGCVCIPSEEDRLNDVAGAMSAMRIEWTFCTPSVASIIEPSSVPTLKTLVCGGEMISAEVINKWTPYVEVINGYGPTETSVFATLAKITPASEPACIGHGIRSTCTWVVDPDDHDRLTPVGSVGELALSGRALAREYLNNPEKTNAEFIDNPRWAAAFPTTTANRIYKTGDLVRYYPNGAIECLGRKDHQVKLHGQRMELGEIESRLSQMDSIRHAIVLLPKTGLIKKRLVAILAVNAGDKSLKSTNDCQLVDPSVMHAAKLPEVQASLEKQLPIYMVPQAWVVMQSLPMLVSGKIDRKQITAWIEQLDKPNYERIMKDYDDIKRGKVPVPETKPAEVGVSTSDILREVCAQVLNLEANELDMQRSFLSLGGDSITGMSVVSKARKQGLTVRLQDIIQTESIEQLAERATLTDNKKKQQVGRPRAASGTNFSLSPIQDLYFQHAANGHKGTSRFNQSITVRISRKIDSAKIREALQTIVLRHGMLRARFSKDSDGTWKQRTTRDIESSYVLRVHATSDREQIKSQMGESQRAPDPEHGPIVVADVFEAPGQDQVLFLVANHLCIDMVSWRVVLQELEEYLHTGNIASEVPLSFQAWCHSQSPGEKDGHSLQIPDGLPNADYWGVEGFENTYGQVKTRGFSLDEQATGMLLDGMHSSAQIEPLDLLLAVAFQSFSQVFPDLADPTIFNESHGRQSTTQDVSETVGWFTSVKALRITRSTKIMDTIKQVKDLRKQTGDLKDLSRRTGPMEILFNYLGKLQQLERSDSLFQHYGDVFAEGELTEYGDMGSRTARFALFELSAIVIKDKLRIAFTFNKKLKHQDNIAEWISTFETILREALPEFRKFANELTPASFPLLPTSSKELKQLVERTLPRMGIQSIAAVEDIYPVAAVQEGILLSQLRDPSNYMFHAIFKVSQNRSGSSVDTKMLAAAWQKVVDRHPILRTVFVESNYKNGTFDQVVLRKVDATPTTIACNEDRGALKKLSAVRLEDVNKQRSPQVPHHVTICRVISTGEVYIKMEMNHALIDGASISIILRDFSAAYGNQLSPTTPGPAYSQFVRYLQGRSDMSGLQYWAHHLRNLQVCHMPVAQNLTKTRRLGSLKVAFHRFDELQALCKQESITFASLAMATWATVLSALTGQDDVCFGYLSAGRDVPVTDIQDAVGVFINMLCCRVKLSSRQGYGSLFRKVQSDFLDGLPHQATSLAEIQNHIGMDGQMMFNTTLSIQNQIPSDASQAENLSFTAKEVHDPSEYPMTVNVITARDNEGIMLRYWSDKISDSRAHAIAAAITQTFENALQDDKDSGTSTPPGLRSPIPSTPMLIPDITSAPSTPQLKGVMTPPYSVDSIDPASLHSLIDERVHAVVSQLLASTSIVKPSAAQPHHLTAARNMQPTILTPPRSEENLSASHSGLALKSVPAVAVDAPAEVPVAAVFEPKLLSIWSQILEVPIDTIGREDSFFRLGGDSIKAMKLASAAREQEMALRVSDIFQAPVFMEMLNLITANSDEPKAPAASQAVGKLSAEAPAKEQLEQPVKPTQRPRARSAFETMQLDSDFLQRSICPQIGIFKGAVADLLPVTDFQAFSLTAQQFKSRWMLNYFFFEGNGPLDVRRLREACKRVLDTFDILRSVFVCAEGQFYQVVLKKMKVDLGVHDTEMELDDFVADLQQKDRDHPPKNGEPFVKFAVVRKAGTNLHRILVRMSHAQYDGVCLWKLLDAIKQGYEGGTLPKTSSFANHMRLMSSSVTPDHYEHFTTLLKDSKMPEIIRRNGPNTYCHVGSSTNVNKTIDISMGSKGSITVATVVQAAWAVTLAKISAQPDVVFGLTINGRNASVPGIETAVGPCVNMIPVRVAFGDQWNGLDLLRYIQDQSVANMPYENLGFREIIHRCTDWPNSSYFTTSVFHQNVHYEGNITLDEEAYRIGGAGVVDNLSDLTFVSTPLAQEGKYHVSLHYSDKGPIDSVFATRVLDMAVDAINSLTTSPNSTLPSPTTLTSLPARQIEESPRPSDGDFLGERLKGTKIDSLLIHSPALTHAWSQVLSPNKKENEASANNDGFQLHSTFFELGGDLLDLGKVVYMLHQDEFNVTLEDLLEHPTFLGQLAVLALNNEDALDDGNETEGDELANKRSSTISSRGVRRNTRRRSRHNKGASVGAEEGAPPMPGAREKLLLQEELNKKNDHETPLASKRSSRRWSRLSFSRRSSVGTMDGERPPMPGPEENQLLQDELNKRALASGDVAAGVNAAPAPKRRRWTLSRRNSVAEPDTALPPMPGPLEHRMLQEQLKHAQVQRDMMESPSGSEPASERTEGTTKSGPRGLWKAIGMSKNKPKKSGLHDSQS